MITPLTLRMQLHFGLEDKHFSNEGSFCTWKWSSMYLDIFTWREGVSVPGDMFNCLFLYLEAFPSLPVVGLPVPLEVCLFVLEVGYLYLLAVLPVPVDGFICTWRSVITLMKVYFCIPGGGSISAIRFLNGKELFKLKSIWAFFQIF
jgi:hypothetical protein